MDISFDPAKNARNIDIHGISLQRASDIDLSLALITEDVRHDYGERRFRALGSIEDRLHVLVFTPRDGRTHVISLRKANKREIRFYASQSQPKSEANGS